MGPTSPCDSTQVVLGSPTASAGLGLAPSSLSQVAVFKNRLFFLAKDSSKLWYGELNAITGTLSDIDLGLVNEMGGNCIAIGSLTLDTGVGVDDLLAVFMSRGMYSSMQDRPIKRGHLADQRHFPSGDRDW